MATNLSNDVSIQFTSPAFKKCCLHSIKYLTSDVIGKKI